MYRICQCVLYSLSQWFPTSGRVPNQGRVGSDLGSPEGFMEKLIIIKKMNFLSKSKQNVGENVVIESVFINFKHTEEINF